MGMSIDEALEFIKQEKPERPTSMYGMMKKNAFNTVIDTMRKYQKIRQIAFPLQFCSTDKLDHEAIMKICEVLEDGNDNWCI